VDVLLTAEGLAAFRQQFVDKYYDPMKGRPRRFTDKANGIAIDILMAGRFHGSGKPGPVAFPHPDQVGEVIEAIQRRYRDFGDVVASTIWMSRLRGGWTRP
jgi:hypothetical protein